MDEDKENNYSGQLGEEISFSGGEAPAGGENSPEATEYRKFGRRTLRDRRSLWKNSKYKGPNRRFRNRRSRKDRRDGNEPVDDLGKYIP
ncbi:MAG: hypothetical protein HY809_01585 [Nitrospirae bacterium]|nr:hypothetical protein [Nitrospirota bacterium]